LATAPGEKEGTGAELTKDALQREITLARSSSSLKELRLFVRESLEKSRLSEYDRGLFSLAVDEVITAMVENAREGGSSDISMHIDISAVAVKLEVEDSENRFGNGLTESALTEARESDKRREIAVYFICEIMDEIYYTYQKGFENRLVMVKFIK
jgi:anti-sigma regulatory factor (Ser/Thr protein kinase)